MYVKSLSRVRLFVTPWTVFHQPSRVRLFVTPWTVVHQPPPSMEFYRQESWSGLPFPSPGDLPDPGIEPGSPTLQAGALPSEPPGNDLWGTPNQDFTFKVLHIATLKKDNAKFTHAVKKKKGLQADDLVQEYKTFSNQAEVQ